MCKREGIQSGEWYDHGGPQKDGLVQEGVYWQLYAGCRKTRESRSVSYIIQLKADEDLNFGSVREDGRKERSEKPWKEEREDLSAFIYTTLLELSGVGATKE